MLLEPECYSAQNKDEDVLFDSTSGGVFSALADVVLKEGGVVIGAAYDADLNVRHKIVGSRVGLKCLRGVKYVHGILEREIFEGIRHTLAQRRRVLFTGLPCQVAAMRKVFDGDPFMLLVDLVCFGAPSHQLWRKYVDWLESKRGKKLVNVNPRDKSSGWGRATYYCYEWADGSIERRSSIFDPYARAFYSTMAFGAGCFRCPFKGGNSRADLTIGDGWGCESVCEGDVSKGVSCVVVRTSLGRRFFEQAKLVKKVVDQGGVERANVPLVSAAKKPASWEPFQRAMMTKSFGELVEMFHLQNTYMDIWIGRFRGWITSLVPVGVRRMIRG